MSAPHGHALDVDGIVELAKLERNGLIESRHLGAAAVVRGTGEATDVETIRALGDVDALVYPRSSLKPFQAITVLRSGVALSGAQLVLATASHSGTAAHVKVVNELLDRAGLSEEDLQCPMSWPGDQDAAAVARTTGKQRRITMNCSGKHAAFLLACVESGWSTRDYLDPQHPLQQAVRATIEEFLGEPVGHVGVDGCGAPLFAVTLRGLATSYSRLARGLGATGHDENAVRITTAIRENGWAIDGPHGANTVVIDELALICKGGAEGVIAMGSADGTAVALKSLDGSHRITSLVALTLLAEAGAIPHAEAERVSALITDQVLGGGVPVGHTLTTF